MHKPHLMTPRWVKTGIYPGNADPIGTILQEPYFFSFDDYPKLFRRLEWWEKRPLDDLPMYLKTHGGIVFRTRWKIRRNNVLTFKNPMGAWGLQSTLSNLLPATELEYHAFTNDHIYPPPPRS